MSGRFWRGARCFGCGRDFPLHPDYDVCERCRRPAALFVWRDGRVEDVFIDEPMPEIRRFVPSEPPPHTFLPLQDPEAYVSVTSFRRAGQLPHSKRWVYEQEPAAKGASET